MEKLRKISTATKKKSDYQSLRFLFFLAVQEHVLLKL